MNQSRLPGTQLRRGACAERSAARADSSMGADLCIVRFGTSAGRKRIESNGNGGACSGEMLKPAQAAARTTGCRRSSQFSTGCFILKDVPMCVLGATSAAPRRRELELRNQQRPGDSHRRTTRNAGREKHLRSSPRPRTLGNRCASVHVRAGSISRGHNSARHTTTGRPPA